MSVYGYIAETLYTPIMATHPWGINAMTPSANLSFDVLIIGSGAAGLSLALRLPANVRTGLVAKRGLEEGNTL